MTTRKPAYVLLILIAAALSTFPLLQLLMGELSNAAKFRRMPFQIPGNLGRVVEANDVISTANYWHDQFVFPSYSHSAKNCLYWNLTGVDPRTKDQTVIPLAAETPGNWGIQSLNFGSRLWMIGNTNAYEIVEGKAKPSTMIYPRAVFDEQQRFLLAGEPAFIQLSNSGFAISKFDGSGWIVTDDLVLPDSSQVYDIDGIPIHFNRAVKAICLNQGDRIHLFLEIDGRMLHHEGLDLRPAATLLTSKGGAPTEVPASVLEAVNQSAGISGWTVINPRTFPGTGHFSSFPAFGSQFAMMVGGQPAAIIVDDSNRGEVLGHFFRLDDGRWSEFAAQTFPFGTKSIRTAVSDDCQTSFIVATTSTGLTYVFEVNATGIRATGGTPVPQLESFVAAQDLSYTAEWQVFGLLVAGLFGFSAALAMRRHTSPEYVFGSHHVELAAIGPRALARIIDLSLIICSTAVLAWRLTLQMDWLSLAEALNMQVPHRSVQSALRILWTLLLWLIVCEGLTVVAQGYWGITPGKWCCGLRTVQTSLRSCGISRSLVREFLLWFDTCGFFCWTPGIASIALTNRRQRLGDIIADTIVVTASSMKSK